jgi:hypothetical protein
MRLHGSDAAVLSADKVTDYLFNEGHARGWAKGRFFERFGFRREDPEGLRQALLEHVRRNPAVLDRVSPYGERWMAFGPIQSPDGRNPVIGTVWQFDTATSYPRFITVELSAGAP